LKDYPEVELIEMDYGYPIPWETIKEGEQVWIVDFSFKLEDMYKLLVITPNIVWIDHHVTAIKELGHLNLPGLRRTDQAGCYLTWEYLNMLHGEKDVKPPFALTLLSDYDNWNHQYLECIPFYSALNSYPTGPTMPIWDEIMTEGPRKLIEEGRTIRRYHQQRMEAYMGRYGHEIEWLGHKVFIVNGGLISSLDYGVRDFPLYAAYVWLPKEDLWSISLRSTRSEVHCGEIAKSFGGGGHKGAAGFTVKQLPWSKNE
jgi:oligoribonuclease NrnB/cAMP/cGMP phosphodiesterase (DHH superfamily)